MYDYTFMLAKADLCYKNGLQHLSQQKKRLNTLKEKSVTLMSYVTDKNIQLQEEKIYATMMVILGRKKKKQRHHHQEKTASFYFPN